MSELAGLLGIKYPIMQGGMARVADGSLASGVSQAGGLGIIAGGNDTADVIRNEIRIARERTDRPFGVNIMLLSRYADDIAQLVLDEGVEVVTTGAGNPARFMESFKAKGIKVIPVIPSVAIAKKMEKLGADAVVAEGMEAGGHIGKLTTMALLPQVVDAVNIPVIAAGGIGDGRAIAAAFMLGAQGVQMGTRFLVAHECNVHPNYKKYVIDSKDIDSTITGAITGHPVRVLRNEFSRKLEEFDFVTKDQKEEVTKKIEELGIGALNRAVKEGDVKGGSVMAGQIAGLVRREQSCAEIIAELVQECRECLGKAGGLL